MSGIRKGGGRGATSQPRRSDASSTKGGKSKKKGSNACFLTGCKESAASREALLQHYEQVFAHNEPTHIHGLTTQLDDHFSSPTSCQICGSPFSHSGTLLEHVFAKATEENVRGRDAKEEQAMHKELFQSFIHELSTLYEVGKEETTEYLLSLCVPDYDPDGEAAADLDDEENDLYEDDEEEYDEDDDDGDFDDEDDGDVDLNELAEFEEFLAMNGMDVDDLDAMGGMPPEFAAMMGMGPFGKKKGSSAAKGGKAGKGGNKKGGVPSSQADFMKFMMQQMGGGGGGDEDEEDDDDRPRKGKKGSKSKPAAAADKSKKASSGASSAPAGHLQCESCEEYRPKDFYSAAQLKKKTKRRCKVCIESTEKEHAKSSATPASSSASTAKVSPSTPNVTSSAAGSNTVKPNSATSSTSSSSSSSTKPNLNGRAHSLHCHHVSKHVLANGQEIEAEAEEFDGSGLEQSETEEEEEDDEEDENDDEEEEDEEEEDEDEDEDMDPFEALFGGGRRRGGKSNGAASSARNKAAVERMNLRLVQERPGQLLTRDRRLRLKASSEFPTRVWNPRTAHDGAKCTVCKWRVGSRLVQDWKLVCQKCGLTKKWIPSESETLGLEEDEDGDEMCRAEQKKQLSTSQHVAFHASTFPNYRGGIEKCIRANCASTQLLLTYDKHHDEWIVCTSCFCCKQKLRYFDKREKRLIDSIQDPVSAD